MKAAPGQEPSGAPPPYRPFAPTLAGIVSRRPQESRANPRGDPYPPTAAPHGTVAPRPPKGAAALDTLRAPSKFRLVPGEGGGPAGPTPTIRRPRTKVEASNRESGVSDHRPQRQDPLALHRSLHQRLQTTVNVLGPAAKDEATSRTTSSSRRGIGCDYGTEGLGFGSLCIAVLLCWSR